MCLEDTVRIPLRARNGAVVGHVIVDAADAEWANQWQWGLGSDGYAKRGVRVDDRILNIYLHRELLGLRPGDRMIGDHINRDRLNCRRANLRSIPRGANPQNRPSFRGSTSKYRGVCWFKETGKWMAQVRYEGKNHYLGLFTNEEEAAEAAKQARLRLMPYATD